MDSGFAILFVPLMFIGGLVSVVVVRLLVPSWRWGVAASLGAVVPPSLMLVADAVRNSATYDASSAEIVAILAVIWAVALVLALAGALFGAFLYARANRNRF